MAPLIAKLGPDVFMLSITDQVSSSFPTVHFSNSEYPVLENQGMLTVNVVLDSAVSQPVTVSWTATDGSARYGVDYRYHGGSTPVPGRCAVPML